MKIPKEIPIYGNINFRDKLCPKESMEQVTFVNRIRSKYPTTYGRILFHPKNEGKLINGQFNAITIDRAMGMSIGCPDIIIPGNPSLCLEIKRRDHSLSVLLNEQIEYLLAAKIAGSYIAVALGCDAAMNAFDDWRKIQNEN